MDRNDTPPEPSKGKGKGKSDGSEPNSGPHSDNTSPSLLSRLARSAGSLARDAVGGRPPGGDLAALVANDKAGPSAGSFQAHNYAHSYAQSREHGSPSARPASAAASAFARGHTQQHVAAQDAAFAQFLDGANMDTSVGQIVGLGSAESDPTEGLPAVPAQQAQQTRQAHAPCSDVAAQEARDGLDVALLLGGASEAEPDYEAIELAEDEAAALQQALWGSGRDADGETRLNTAQWDHALNFVPDFMPRASGSSGSAGDERQAWLAQWQAVLTRYDDEVWGGLAPLVVEARAEVEELVEEAEAASSVPETPPSTKALARLRQILGHLRETP